MLSWQPLFVVFGKHIVTGDAPIICFLTKSNPHSLTATILSQYNIEMKIALIRAKLFACDE